MRHAMRWALAVLLAGGIAGEVARAQEAAKALPTLLIKGEVVSVDTANPAGILLKVKDRYGFETPIYLAQETKITQGGQSLNAEGLAAGTPIEVEYNFDINTAKRHAVNVTVSAPAAPTAAAPRTPAAPAAPEPAAEPAATPAAESSPAPAAESAPAQEPAAPASEQTAP